MGLYIFLSKGYSTGEKSQGMLKAKAIYNIHGNEYVIGGEYSTVVTKLIVTS